MQPENDNSVAEPFLRMRSMKQRLMWPVAVALGLVWTGYFLNNARWYYSQ